MKSYSIYNISGLHKPINPCLSLSEEENSFKNNRRKYKSPPLFTSFQANIKSDKKIINGFLRKSGHIRKNIKSCNALLDINVNLIKESCYSQKSEPKMTLSSEFLGSQKNQTTLKAPLYEINRLKSRNTTITETRSKYSFPLVATGDETCDNESSLSGLFLLNKSKRHSANHQKRNKPLCFSPEHNSLTLNSSQTTNIIENSNTNKVITFNQINGLDEPSNGYKKFVKQLSHIPEINQLMEEANSTRPINLKENSNRNIFESGIKTKIKHSITTNNCNKNNISIIKFNQENSVLSEKGRKAPSQSNFEVCDKILGSLIHESSFKKIYAKRSFKKERSKVKGNNKPNLNNDINFATKSSILVKLSIDISDELDKIDKDKEKNKNFLKNKVYNYIYKEPKEINTEKNISFYKKSDTPFDNQMNEMKLRFIVSSSLKLLNSKNKKSFFMIQKPTKTLILNKYFEIDFDLEILKGKYLDNVMEFEKKNSLLDNFSKKGCEGKKKSFQASGTFSLPRKRARMITLKTKTMPKVIVMSSDDFHFLNSFLKKDYFVSDGPMLKIQNKLKKGDSSKSCKTLIIQKSRFQKQSTFKIMKKSKTKISGFNFSMKEKSNIF